MMMNKNLAIQLIQPKYTTDMNTGDILLKRGQGKLRVDEKKIPCHIVARLCFLPEPRVLFKCDFNSRYGLSLESIITNGRGLKFNGNFFDILPISMLPTFSLDNVFQCMYMLKNEAIVTGTEDTEIDKLTIHVFGFDRLWLHKTFIHIEGITHTHVGYAICDLGEFRVVLQELPKPANAAKGENSIVRTHFSHVLQITKRDGSIFTPKTVDKYTKALGMTLSFMQGAMNFGSFSVGFRAGDIMFEFWPILHNKCHNHDNWFDLYYHPDVSSSYFEEIYPLIFHQIAGKSDEVFWDRIFMTYCQANSVTYVPNAIILTQVALETMSHQWIHSQSDTSEIKNTDDCDKSAIRIRNFLCREGIPLEISHYDPKFAESFRKAGFGKWDVVRLHSDFRNSYIHADNTKIEKLNLTVDEILRVSQIFLLVLEYAILRMLGYDGYYRNRLKNARPGEVERVPWAK